MKGYLILDALFPSRILFLVSGVGDASKVRFYRNKWLLKVRGSWGFLFSELRDGFGLWKVARKGEIFFDGGALFILALFFLNRIS